MQYPAVDTGHWRIGMDSDGFMVIGVLHGSMMSGRTSELVC